MPYYDLSPLLDETTPVWPGDAPLSRERVLELAKGDSITLSTLTATVHLGSHADAPNHFKAGAPGIGEQDPRTYIGHCQVIEVNAEKGVPIEPGMLEQAVASTRVLLKTRTGSDGAVFPEDFAYLSGALVRELARHNVRLIGTDAPSVDAFDSKALPMHHACLENNINIVEGLMLSDVPAGCYFLAALPLRLAGFDGSPVRAVLFELDDVVKLAKDPN
jgi:arylformamidase